MKRIVLLVLAVFTLLVSPSYAGFIVKKHPVKPAVEVVSGTAITGKMQMTSQVAGLSAMETRADAQKGSFFTRIVKKLAKPEAAMPPIVYILLAILGLGWLAMGINDNFNDWDWIISLLLYCLFYLPGLIYTLIKMNKYY